MNKEKWMHAAEVIDAMRVFPRLFLIACFAWNVWIAATLLEWYMALPKDDRSLEASGFASIVFLAIVGFTKLVYETYSRNSVNWELRASKSEDQA